MFFTCTSGDDMFGVWFTLSSSWQSDSANEGLMSDAGTRQAPSERPFLMTVFDNKTCSVYGKTIDKSALKEGSDADMTDLHNYLLRDKTNIVVDVEKVESDSGNTTASFDVTAWICDSGVRQLMVMGPVNIHSSDALEDGVMGLFHNVGNDLHAMIRAAGKGEEENKHRDKGYRELSRKLAKWQEDKDALLSQVYAGFAVIINDKNRTITDLMESRRELLEQKAAAEVAVHVFGSSGGGGDDGGSMDAKRDSNQQTRTASSSSSSSSSSCGSGSGVPVAKRKGRPPKSAQQGQEPAMKASKGGTAAAAAAAAAPPPSQKRKQISLLSDSDSD